MRFLLDHRFAQGGVSMTLSSKLVDCTSGSPAGFAPLGAHPALTPTRRSFECELALAHGIDFRRLGREICSRANGRLILPAVCGERQPCEP